jgi:DNA-binding CsgD family transcriptional regulator
MLAVLLHLSAWCYAGETEISGKIHLDTAWANKVYVCRIPDFDNMYTASDKLIVGRGDVDAGGNFKLTFPVGNDYALYRLHFIRRNDPPSTLIIGSKDENHVFLIAKAGDHIYFEGGNGARAISQAGISGSIANQELNFLFSRINSDETDQGSIDDTLLMIAKRSHSELVNLLAVHYLLGLNSSQKSELEGILSHLDKNNRYGTRLFQEYQNPRNWILYAIAGLILLGVALLLGNHFYKKRVIHRIHQILSHREVHIVTLILSGKSNKEIAAILNIELSTVKTHVNNIYAKLKIGSRKKLNKYSGLLSATGG